MIGISLITLAILSWLGVLGFTTPSLWALYTSRGRRGDPGRLLCALFALLMVGMLSRRVLVQESTSDISIIGLMIAAIGVAGFTIYIAVAYGRGHRV